jgi:SAM-dependent methyltransferase
LDIDEAASRFSQIYDPATQYVVGDGASLPFGTDQYHVCLCHYLLMWVELPARLLEEMVRVTRPGGSVLALAEPDYGGRLDHPPELSLLGELQTKSLRRQGANPEIGRRLRGIFSRAGLQQVLVGVLGGEWTEGTGGLDPDSEWATLQQDLAAIKPRIDLEALRRLDRQAWDRGERILYVPTFYAVGKVPEDGQPVNQD